MITLHRLNDCTSPLNPKFSCYMCRLRALTYVHFQNKGFVEASLTHSQLQGRAVAEKTGEDAIFLAIRKLNFSCELAA